MGQAEAATDRGQIRRWIEFRKRRSSTAKDTGGGGGKDLLRADFRYSDEIEDRELAFLARDGVVVGEESRPPEFVGRAV